MMWLRDFHFDALRLDAVHAIRDYSPNHFIKELNDKVRLLNEQSVSTRYLIAETDLNDNIYIRDEDKGGYGVTAQWNDEFHHALRVCAGQEKTGYYIDYNGVADLAKSMQQAYVYTGQYSEFRHRKFGTSTEGISNDHFVVFDQNHDQVGNRMLGERLSQLVSFEMQKLLPAVVLTSPFIPLLFMGEEWGAGAPFPYFMDLSEPKLIEGVSKGRKEEFKHFISQGEPLPAHEETTFLKTKLNWGELAEKQHRQLFGYYRQLISLRKQLDIFRNYDRKTVKVSYEEDKNIIVLKRNDQKKEIICIYNFSKQLQVIEVGATFDFEILLYSADLQWGGQGYADSDIQDGKVSIKPESAIVLLHSFPRVSFVFYHQD
jgi:maltooligosyltrehalose trehalohydrolase